MKAVVVAVAAAGIVGGVRADGWEQWSTTSADPAKTTTTSETSTTTSSSSTINWAEWEGTTTSSTSEDPATTTTSTINWGEWESTSSSTSVDPVSTSTETWAEWTATSSSVDPTSTSTETWGEWTTTSTSVDPASTSTETWGEWDEATTYTTKTGTLTVTKTVLPKKSSTTASTASAVTSAVSSAWSHDGWFGGAWSTAVDGQCVMNIITSYGFPIWKPTPGVTSSADPTSTETWGAWTTTSSSSVDPTSTSTETWAEWTATSSSVDPASTSTETWAEWTATSSSVDPTSTSTETWAEWTATSSSVDPTSASTETWAEWTTTSSASSADPTSTETWAEWTPSASAAAFYSASTSSASASSTSSSGGKGGAGISSNGNSWAMTYTPYTAAGGCKDASTVSADIAKLAAKGFTSVRVYSTDCSTLENVGSAARANNIKIILGVFISKTGISGAQSQVTDIAKWAQWDLVSLIVVGNEAIFNKYCSAGELASFISSCKSAFAGTGYTGSVTTTEDLATWQSVGSQLCSVVDVVAANLYAFFNPNTKASDAGEFIQAEIADLAAICGNKETYVMESGWPSAGQCNGVACPGKDEQATAIKAIQGAVGSKIVFFSFEDELWKGAGEFDVEQHWGCADVF